MSRLQCPGCGAVLTFRSDPLTRLQAKILRYLADSIHLNGFAPSFDEIATHFGYRSLATVHEHLRTLERKGVIRRSYNEARAIVILVDPDTVTLRAVKLLERAS